MSLQTIVKLAAVAGAAVGGAAVVNATIARLSPKLEPWFDDELGTYFWKGHRIVYSVRGEGSPVLLVHGIHAAASSFEWRRNVEFLSRRFRVTSVDLLGFGLSDRPAISYSAETYIALLMDFIRDVLPAPPAVVASSLSATYAVSMAFRAPASIAGLVLVNPVGIESLNRQAGPLEVVLHGALESPVVGQSLYNVLVSDASIRHFLREQVFASADAVDEALVAQMYATSHQPGARHAPAAFIGGALNCAIDEIFPRLAVPTLVMLGRDARFGASVSADDFSRLNPDVRVRTIANAGLLPHDERSADFNDVVTQFLE